MTDDQKQAISRLRSEGWGYNKISGFIGVNENTVKSYCRRNNLTGYGSKFVKERPNAPYGRCKNCGAIVEQDPKRKTKLFCSDDCRMKWWGLHRDQIKHRAVKSITCPNCGKQIIVYGNASRKYCCHECYIADRFGKRGEDDHGTEKHQEFADKQESIDKQESDSEQRL